MHDISKLSNDLQSTPISNIRLSINGKTLGYAGGAPKTPFSTFGFKEVKGKSKGSQKETMTSGQEKQLQKIEKRMNATTKAFAGFWLPRQHMKDGSTYYPPGAILGETLISLGDVYEGCEADCEFVENTLEDMAWLIALVRKATPKRKP